MIRNKTIKFDMEKPEEKELWDWLQMQPHGDFSVITKQFWRLSKEKGSQLHKLLHDEYWDDLRKKTEMKE
ncbi:hypothetical protein H7B90_23490 [Cohnella xylanilytica]|uniref:Uncharacterized protein n=1 Tax=Cohnella xylanilytica TaxID=557555 RepID=A0A841U8D9_9BACL|nr:hypothetical protein [Cohnella xylanilytica]MBB6694364.1 hypothetical protein [Cohnella xylanilytica]